jgi:hypothetical protein
VADTTSRTWTFLFTDIKGSTVRWNTDGASMDAALAAHDRVLHDAIEAHGGRVFKHTGDGVCAAFSSTRAAVDAAVAAQRLLALPVRMGIHTGEAHARGGDFFGPSLNRCARLMDAGHGGQILVSATTRALLDGGDLTDLGVHHLRDMPVPERIFQVGSRMGDHTAGLLRQIVDTTFTGELDVGRLRAELPNVRQLFDEALERADVAGAIRYLAPLIELVGLTDWAANGWADRALAIARPDDAVHMTVLHTARLVDAFVAGDHGRLRGIGRDVLRATDAAGSAAWWVRHALALFLQVGGDLATAIREADAAVLAAGAVSPDIELFCTIFAAWARVTAAAEQLGPEVDADIARGLEHPSVAIQGQAAMVQSVLAHRRGDHPAMLHAARRCAACAVEGPAMWFGALQLEAWAQVSLGAVAETLALIDTDFAHAQQYGDRSELINPLAVCALALRKLRAPEAAAIVRGWLPARLTVLFVEEMPDLDRWLAEALPADRLDDLMARGRALDAGEVKRLARQVMERHIGVDG